MSLITLYGVDFNLEESKQFQFLITNKELSKVFACDESTIRRHKSDKKTELIENKHFLISRDSNNRKITKWTRNGVVRLGFFINSQRAKDFRDWAEDYIIDNMQKDADAIRRGYRSQLSQQKKKFENIISELENNQKLLPAPSVDLETYKAEIGRLRDELNKMFELKEHFSYMAGVQVFKTVAMFGVEDELVEFQAKFLNNPKIYNTIGELIRKVRIIKQETNVNAESFDPKLVKNAQKAYS